MSRTSTTLVNLLELYQPNSRRLPMARRLLRMGFAAVLILVVAIAFCGNAAAVWMDDCGPSYSPPYSYVDYAATERAREEGQYAGFALGGVVGVLAGLLLAAISRRR